MPFLAILGDRVQKMRYPPAKSLPCGYSHAPRPAWVQIEDIQLSCWTVVLMFVYGCVTKIWRVGDVTVNRTGAKDTLRIWVLRI